MRVTLSIDDDIHQLIRMESQRTGETMGVVLSRICREEVIKILIDAKRPAAERLYQSNKISFDEYRTMNGYREIIRAAGL